MENQAEKERERRGKDEFYKRERASETYDRVTRDSLDVLKHEIDAIHGALLMVTIVASKMKFEALKSRALFEHFEVTGMQRHTRRLTRPAQVD